MVGGGDRVSTSGECCLVLGFKPENEGLGASLGLPLKVRAVVVEFVMASFLGAISFTWFCFGVSTFCLGACGGG